MKILQAIWVNCCVGRRNSDVKFLCFDPFADVQNTENYYYFLKPRIIIIIIIIKIIIIIIIIIIFFFLFFYFFYPW